MTDPDDYRKGTEIKCAVEDCDTPPVDDHYWGKVKAQDDGWFFQKTGEAWCPEHVPDWVEGWRARTPKTHRQGVPRRNKASDVSASAGTHDRGGRMDLHHVSPGMLDLEGKQ